jgi:hypothetical protein
MQIADRCAPWKISNSAQNPVLQALQFLLDQVMAQSVLARTTKKSPNIRAEVRMLTRYRGNANLQRVSYPPWPWITLETCPRMVTSNYVTISFKYSTHLAHISPPLWSSGQSSWLLTQSSRVRFPTLQDLLSSSCSRTDPLSLVRINRELRLRSTEQD